VIFFQTRMFKKKISCSEKKLHVDMKILHVKLGFFSEHASRKKSYVNMEHLFLMVIPKEGPGTARDEGGTAGADPRVQQAAADEAKKLVHTAALAAQRLVDATKEAEETATAAAAAAALSAPEEAQVSLSGSTATAAC